MKVVLITMYFGKLPNYFSLFLKSCEKNKDFNWLIFTDDNTNYNYPKNVKRVNMNFEQCKKIFQEKFDFKLALESPKKLCDFKCAYGYLLEDYIKDYGFWGHCDLDQIFGDLSKFITKENLKKYDKLYTLGHLTLYRNNKDVNRQFMNSLKGIKRYKEVFSDCNGNGFDEWIEGNINEIFYDSKYSFLDTSIGADIDPYSTTFILDWYDKKEKRYFRDSIRKNLFKWQDGNLYRYYLDNNLVVKEEFPYIHLQKRKMKNYDKCIESTSFYIIPNKFVDEKDLDMNKFLFSSSVYEYINYQYFLVKWKSLKLRIKTKNFKFNSVFR